MKYYYEAYNQRYKIIHEKGYSWSSDIPTPIVSDVIQKHSISKNASILEIGCGEGRYAFPLLENGYDVLATDISSEAINYCKNLRPDYSIHFSILDYINDHHEQHYDFIYSVAVIHMLVSDEDRIRFYHFIYDHLLDGRLALICSMGDGLTESETDISSAFNMVERHHDSGFVMVPSTSLRMVNFDTLKKEIESTRFSIVEQGITSSFPDFNNLMYVVIRKHE